jgi:hypothetical protein
VESINIIIQKSSRLIIDYSFILPYFVSPKNKNIEKKEKMNFVF